VEIMGLQKFLKLVSLRVDVQANTSSLTGTVAEMTPTQAGRYLVCVAKTHRIHFNRYIILLFMQLIINSELPPNENPIVPSGD
jgi:hypothetical protein